MRTVDLILHDIRSTHNVGSLLRTAEGLGIKKVYITGYSPYPELINDDRLPHLSRKLDSQIHKTALGAENTIAWEHEADVFDLIGRLQNDGYDIVALEQDERSVKLTDYKAAQKVALLVGNEVKGIEQSLLDKCHQIIEIPMKGQKESFNVVQAAAMALFFITALTH